LCDLSGTRALKGRDGAYLDLRIAADLTADPPCELCQGDRHRYFLPSFFSTLSVRSTFLLA
jgi:hypothetical protein